MEPPHNLLQFHHHRTGQKRIAYSSVCGTGLDVVPLTGDTSVNELAALIRELRGPRDELGVMPVGGLRYAR